MPTPIHVIAFDRSHTTYVVFQSRGFYNVPRVLIVDARPFQVFAPSWTNRHTWPRYHAGIDPMPDWMNLDFDLTKLN